MFAIRSGSTDKFIKVNAPYGTVFDITVSSKPKIFKTKSAAEKAMIAALDYAKYTLESNKKYNEEQNATRKSALKSIEKDTNELESLYELPYKEVFKKIALIEKRVEKNRKLAEDSAFYAVAPAVTKRLEKILANGMNIVTVATVVA